MAGQGASTPRVEASQQGPGQTEEHRRFNAKYRREGVPPLGRGAYGEVTLATEIATGRRFAIKNTPLDEEEGVVGTTIREISVLKSLNHPNVIKCVDVYHFRTRMYLVLDYMDQDLRGYIRSHQRRLIDERNISKLALQLCSGMEYCHSKWTIHRDLKPGNLLINRASLCLKIADFGLARAILLPMPKYTPEVVTLWYRPMEILLGGQRYDFAVDMWSVGCILGELAAGRELFTCNVRSEIGTIFQIMRRLGSPTLATWPGLKDMKDWKSTFPEFPAKDWSVTTQERLGQAGTDLLDSLLVYDPSRRLSARRALQHPYFFGVQAPVDPDAPAAPGAPEGRGAVPDGVEVEGAAAITVEVTAVADAANVDVADVATATAAAAAVGDATAAAASAVADVADVAATAAAAPAAVPAITGRGGLPEFEGARPDNFEAAQMLILGVGSLSLQE